MKKYKVLTLVFVISLVFTNMAFCGPFGIDFGMSLEQIRRVSKTEPENIETDWYIITPPRTNDLFETYLVQIHATYGVYFIRAVSKDISTNRQGTTLRNQFNNLVSSIERTYGKYTLEDFSVFGSYWGDKPDDYMFALSRDERVLEAYWDEAAGSKLPAELALIIVVAGGRSSSIGYLEINYYSIYDEKVEEEQNSVF
jgi:hypothetical protein